MSEDLWHPLTPASTPHKHGELHLATDCPSSNVVELSPSRSVHQPPSMPRQQQQSGRVGDQQKDHPRKDQEVDEALSPEKQSLSTIELKLPKFPDVNNESIDRGKIC